jgi:hypothetical protein
MAQRPLSYDPWGPPGIMTGRIMDTDRRGPGLAQIRVSTNRRLVQ